MVETSVIWKLYTIMSWPGLTCRGLQLCMRQQSSLQIVPWDKNPFLFEDLGDIHHNIATKLTTGDAGSLIRKEEMGGETEE